MRPMTPTRERWTPGQTRGTQDSYELQLLTSNNIGRGTPRGCPGRIEKRLATRAPTRGAPTDLLREGVTGNGWCMREIEAFIFDMDGVIVDSELHWKSVEGYFLQSLIPGWTQEDQGRIIGLS